MFLTKIFRSFVASVLLVSNFICLGQGKIIFNSVEPANYFSGRKVELADLSYNLIYYKKASIVGISGIGKTQLIRKFVQNDKYEIIWFFDCNQDFDSQYLNLAKHINQNIKDKNLSIDEDYAGLKERVLDYLKPKENWLLVYDNLKLGQNNLIKDIIELEVNGHIIIASQDGTNLPHTTYLQPLKETESIEIIHKILPNNQHANYLNNSSKGYPLLVARGAMLLKTDSYLSHDYKQLLLKQESSIKSYIKLLIGKLSSSEKDLLYKIAVINYQNFSRNFLEKIINYPDKFKQDLYHLMQLGLVINVGGNEENERFEMHETIKEQIVSSASFKVIKNIVSEAITKATEMIPVSSAIRYLTFINDQTLIANFEKLLSNAELYEINKNQILSIREKLITFYVPQRDFVKCQEMAQWLLSYKNDYWNLWTISEEDKVLYASYLNYIGIYEEWANKNFNLAINLKNEANDILMTTKNNYEHKFTLLIQIAQSYIASENINEANKSLIKAQKFMQNVQERNMFFFIKTKIFLSQGLLYDALNTINNLQIDDSHINSFTSPILGLRARIFNYLQNYQEAYDILYRVYLAEKDKNQYSDLLVAILVELSRALIGMKQYNIAFQYVKNAKNVAMSQHERLNIPILLSQDWILASALKVEADCLSALGNYSQAITNYAQAETIFYNLYRENMKNAPLISSLYFNGTNAACKLKDKFWFNKFKREHLAKFGNTHPKSQEIRAMQCF